MINKREFKNICSYSLEHLKTNKTLSNIANPFLFIIRAHPFILQRYEDVYKYNLSFILIIKIILKIIYNI